MVSKCANPECSKPLQYLRDGKVYRIEVQEFPANSVDPFLNVSSKKPVKRVEHFWLCGDCAQTMSVSIDNAAHSVTVVPIERPLYRKAAAAAS